MDATVVAAMITAGTKLGQSLFDQWVGRKSEDKTNSFVQKHYDQLRGLISDNCMRLLVRMEDGQYHDTDQLMKYLYQSADTAARQEPLRSEFKYRLRFMTLAGVLVNPPSNEYYITQVGKEFVKQARERKDYYKVFFN